MVLLDSVYPRLYALLREPSWRSFRVLANPPADQQVGLSVSPAGTSAQPEVLVGADTAQALTSMGRTAELVTLAWVEGPSAANSQHGPFEPAMVSLPSSCRDGAVDAWERRILLPEISLDEAKAADMQQRSGTAPSDDVDFEIAAIGRQSRPPESGSQTAPMPDASSPGGGRRDHQDPDHLGA